MKSQPKGAAPVSREVVEGVKRKMAAPAGPPPAGMMNFNAPKNHAAKPSQTERPRYDEYDNDYDDYHGDHRDGSYDEEDDEYYPDDRNADDRNDRSGRVDRSRDSYEDDRDYRYDGGNDRSNYDEDRNRSNYNDHGDRGGGRDARDARDDHSADREEDRFPSRHAERELPNPHAQSKQYSAPHPAHSSTAEGKAVAEHDAKTVPAEVRRDVSAPSGNALQVINAYLQRSRTTLLSYQPVLRATYRELKYYVTSPCPPGFTARCYIERNRSGSKMLAPYYSICADLDDGTGRELMVCRKVMRSRSPHYIFSLKSEDLWRKREQRSRLYLGKLRATSSQDYVLYDNGICEAPEEPESLLLERERDHGDIETSADRDTVLSKKMARDRKATSGDGNAGTASAEEVSLYRSELLAIHFNCKNRPAPAGKRGTEVCLPHNFAVDSSGRTSILGKSVSPPSSGSLPAAALADPKGVHSIGITKNTAMYNIVKPFEKVRDTDRQNELYAKSCFVLHERTSRYDPLSSCLVDFKGRANMASVKNCQFVVSEPASEASNTASAEAQMKFDAEKDFVLQLGKTTDDCFNMDYRYPLNLLQAFAICIARFDAKLTW